jgi:hypothetical protein
MNPLSPIVWTAKQLGATSCSLDAKTRKICLNGVGLDEAGLQARASFF